MLLYSGSDKQIQGLDLTDRVPEELWMKVRDIVQEAVIKIILLKEERKRNVKRQNGVLMRPYK